MSQMNATLAKLEELVKLQKSAPVQSESSMNASALLPQQLLSHLIGKKSCVLFFSNAF
jgi:hypothetical protein